MSKQGKIVMALGIVMILAIAVSVVFAPPEEQKKTKPESQRPTTEQRAGRRGGGREGRMFDRDALQERMTAAMKKQLAASDDEWKIIEPRLTKVMTKSRDVNQRGIAAMAMMGRRGGRGDRENQRRSRRGEAEGSRTNPVQQASEALQQTLEKSDSTPEDIKAKLLGFRSAREKANQELSKAQQELREVLTVRQEARLVLIGLLN